MPSNIWENVGYNCLFHTLSLYSCNKHVCSSCFSFLFLSYSSFHYQDFWSVTVVHTRTRTHIFLHYIAQSTSTATLHYQTVWNLLNYTLCKIEHPDREKGHYKRIPRQKWSRSKTIYVASKPTDSLYRIWRTAWCFRSVRVVAKSGYYQRHLRPSVRPVAWIDEAPTEHIPVKLYIGDFYENLSRHTKSGYNRTKNRVLYMIT